MRNVLSMLRGASPSRSGDIQKLFDQRIGNAGWLMLCGSRINLRMAVPRKFVSIAENSASSACGS